MHSSIPLLSWHFRGRSHRRDRYHRLTPAVLHFFAVHTRRRLRIEYACARLVAALHVDVFDVEGVDMAGDKGQHREADVDEEVGAAAGDEEDTNRWHWGGSVSWEDAQRMVKGRDWETY